MNIIANNVASKLFVAFVAAAASLYLRPEAHRLWRGGAEHSVGSNRRCAAIADQAGYVRPVVAGLGFVRRHSILDRA